ncbi:TauD/TfdA family dioxygenase [Saccharopolyspora spinosa]|uniref:TauD/TfdA family dioxygenase n=1 Tax=Saccharopolyspora spinosa TaxID=60894 RepID=UPI003747AAC6
MTTARASISRAEGPAVWTGAELQNSDDWIYHLSASQIAELDEALKHAKGLGLPLKDVTLDDFPLRAFGNDLARLSDEIESGRGFVLIRGLPVDEYSAEDAGLIYWGIGRHLGVPVPQNATGDLLGHVRDLGGREGRMIGKNASRGYNSNAGLAYHCDGSDVVGLLCLKTARVGGASTVVSTGAIHNKILDVRPDLLEVLYDDFPQDFHGEQPEGYPKYNWSPVFANHLGQLSSRYVPSHIRGAFKNYEELGGLSGEKLEALDLMDRYANELALSMDFERGDIQLLNNHTTLHSRTRFEDFDEPEKKRHLLRLWITLYRGKPLPAGFGRNPGYVDTTGARGGLPLSA